MRRALTKVAAVLVVCVLLVGLAGCEYADLNPASGVMDDAGAGAAKTVLTNVKHRHGALIYGGTF